KASKPVPELSDIYALGLVAFQMFQGSHPLVLQEPNANFRNHHVVWKLQLSTEPPMLHEVMPDFPIAVSYLVNTAIAKRPSARISTMAEFGAKAKTARLKFLATTSDSSYSPVAGSPSNTAQRARDVVAAGLTEPMERKGTKKLFNEASAPTLYVDSIATALERPSD